MDAVVIAALEAENATLRTANASLTDANAAFQSQVADLTRKLEVLHHRVFHMSRRIFANTSERHDPNQQNIFASDAAVVAATSATTATAAKPDAPAGAAATSDPPARTRGGKKPGEGRLAIPVHLEEREEIIDLPESERSIRPTAHPPAWFDHAMLPGCPASSN